MKSNLKAAPGIYIDDFSGDLCDIASNIADIGRILSTDVEYVDDLDDIESLENDLYSKITEIGTTLYSFINEFADYRAYLRKCILAKGDCGYTEGELMRFSVGILENIFVLNHCHDVDYLEVVRYNKEHSNDSEGGASDEK